MYYETKVEAITGHVTDDGTLLVLSHQIARPVSKHAPRCLTCVQGFWAFNSSAQCEVNVWICAPTTERDLACFSAVKKGSAWICAPATERDLASFSAVKKVSAWICALAADCVSGYLSQAVTNCSFRFYFSDGLSE